MSKTQVKPIPEGMHTVTPHLVCAGAADAIEFYKKAFNAVEIGRMVGPQGKLLHGLIRIGDSKVMLVDEFPDRGSFGPKSLKGSPVTMHLYVEDVRFVRRARRSRGGEDHHAAPGHVLGRSLRQTRRPVWPPLVGRHTRSRCQPRRDATGGAESM